MDVVRFGNEYGVRRDWVFRLDFVDAFAGDGVHFCRISHKTEVGVGAAAEAHRALFLRHFEDLVQGCAAPHGVDFFSLTTQLGSEAVVVHPIFREEEAVGFEGSGADAVHLFHPSASKVR